MQLLVVLLGLIVLIYGRRLFWLFVAIAGFLAGMEFTRAFFDNQPYWVMLLGGVSAGMIGSMLAVFVERIAFALAGFYAGAYLGLSIYHYLGFMGKGVSFILIGGLIGAIFSGLLMNWAIILLSSLVGAAAISSQLELDQTFRPIVFAAFVIIGAYTQSRGMDQTRAALF
jgi:Domain of unknown function (DUF4203)